MLYNLRVESAVPAPLDDAFVTRALNTSRAEAAAGRIAESDRILASLAQRVPNHPAVLNELGVRMLNQQMPEKAHQLFARATQADPNHPALWANLASSLKALGRRAEEIEALEKALAIDPRHLSALLQKGAHQEETGDPRNAARTYANAMQAFPAGAAVPPNLAQAVDDARAKIKADADALRSALEGPLRTIRESQGGRPQRRVEQCIDILLGERRPYHSQPTWMYFPELPPIEFFDRSLFPWLEALEAVTTDIRSELLRVMVSDREGLQPYLDFPDGLPIDQFKEINRSLKWSAYFLWNQSDPVPGHIARCPVTSRTLEEVVPRCRVAGRAPTAFFSILAPATRIPAHTGVTNTRCTVHLPLVVPPDCGFRVGSTTREWVPGQAWVFDDTIEHEAWNLSDAPRAVLIFDIWNPLLSQEEREMIRTVTEVYHEYYSRPKAVSA
jgi:aspartyl/asparaginyl beta-hydroxylase (cupin superfamily)/Flp pilus assembly protein TadD